MASMISCRNESSLMLCWIDCWFSKYGSRRWIRWNEHITFPSIARSWRDNKTKCCDPLWEHQTEYVTYGKKDYPFCLKDKGNFHFRMVVNQPIVYKQYDSVQEIIIYNFSSVVWWINVLSISTHVATHTITHHQWCVICSKACWKERIFQLCYAGDILRFSWFCALQEVKVVAQAQSQTVFLKHIISQSVPSMSHKKNITYWQCKNCHQGHSVRQNTI
jgi:hypothetical protein